ncbi:MAG: hypothetical protein WBH36_14235 [Syntrophobacteria bacterium]
MFQHVICVYPYRRELDHAGYFPPRGLEIIATVLRSYLRALDIVDLRKQAGRTQDFLRQDSERRLGLIPIVTKSP